MQLEDVKAYLMPEYTIYRQILEKAVSSEEESLERINRYILSNNGKEIRPILSLLSGKLCGTLLPLSYDIAAISEIIHTATLIHDDVADNANTRRNAPTIRSLFSPSVAVLMGDFWLSRALHLLSSNLESRIVQIFTKAVERMSEGEIIQINRAETALTTQEDYFDIIERKTSALFIASMKSGAYVVKASDSQIDAIASFATHLGNAFQIRDDIMDYSPHLKTGKTSGLDLLEKKITLPLIGAMKNCPNREEYVRGLVHQIVINPSCEEEINRNKAIQKEVVEFVAQNDGYQYARKILTQESQRAKESLNCFNNKKEKEILNFLVDYMADREV